MSDISATSRADPLTAIDSGYPLQLSGLISVMAVTV